MASDLTERLAAKLYDGTHFNAGEARMAAKFAKRILPLLLSEPELVAGLAPEVKREVLRVLARDIPEKGMMEAPVHYDASEAWAWAVGWTALREHLLAPSPAPMEGTNDE